MNIQKGKNKLKNISVEDIAYQGRDKNKVFMQTSEKEKVNQVIPTKEYNVDVENEIQTRKDYNTNIVNLDERYTKLVPLNSYIVRMQVMEDEVKKLGNIDLVLPTTSFERKKTQSGRLGDKIIDPFRFKQSAVIVAVPSYETELKPGMMVQIVKPRGMTDEDSVVGYEYEYVHPDYLYPMVPKSVTDPDFGYAIIPKQLIKVIIK